MFSEQSHSEGENGGMGQGELEREGDGGHSGRLWKHHGGEVMSL